jgi:hypothetical protein
MAGVSSRYHRLWLLVPIAMKYEDLLESLRELIPRKRNKQREKKQKNGSQPPLQNQAQLSR